MADRIRAIVRGRVQAVGFRDFARREATALGLSGFVRNCPDGSVECVAQGPREALDRLVERLRVGPPIAHVERVDVSEERGEERMQGFAIRY